MKIFDYLKTMAITVTGRLAYPWGKPAPVKTRKAGKKRGRKPRVKK